MGITMLGEGNGDEKDKELMEEEKGANVKFFDFEDYNEILVNEAAFQKVTRLDDTGIQVHW